MTTEKFFTPTKVARRVGVSPWCIRDWIRKGKVRAYRFSRNTQRIPESELMRLMAEAAPVLPDFKCRAAGDI